MSQDTFQQDTSDGDPVDRIIEVFPSNEQMQIRSTLADGLRVVGAADISPTHSGKDLGTDDRSR